MCKSRKNMKKNMMTKIGQYYSKQLLRFLCFVSLISLFDNHLVQGQTENTRSSQQDTVAVPYPTQKKEIRAEIARLNKCISQCEQTIKYYPKRDFTPTTMFQLSKLYVKKGKLVFELELDKFLVDLERFDRGILKEEPQEPKIDYEPSIKLCEVILNRFPNIDFKEKLLYWYGLCLYENSNRKRAAEVFQKMVKDYPKTEYLDEINFRIGEYYFDAQEYNKAIATYSKTIKIWNNPFFAMSLYKLAWSYYKLDNYAQSIGTFFYLLGDLDMLDSLNCAEIGRTTVDLREEAINYIAICFSEYGGLPLAKSFLKEIKGSKAQVVAILHRLADVYRKRSYYDKALGIYNELLKKYPYYSKAPEIQYSIFDCYNKQDYKEKALKAREKLAKRFKPKSKWVLNNPNPEVQNQVSEFLKKIDFILATPIINKADELLSSGDLKNAVRIYRDFVRNFPKDERSPRALFNAAECLFELKNYKKAALMYYLIVKNYAPHELTEDAAYNRVLCYDVLLQLETNPKPDTFILGSGRKKCKIPVHSKAQKELLIACNDFLGAVPKGDKTVEILLKTAEQFAKLEQYQMAEGLLHKAMNAITKHNYGLKFYTPAASLMAQVNYMQKKYKNAEKWYILLAQSAKDSVELVENSLKMMASSGYKIAEKLMAKGDSVKAAKQFERVALRYGNSEIGERSTFESAVQYEKSGNFKKAVKLFELFSRRYPESEYIEQSLFRAARIRERLGAWKNAAQNYMKVYQLNPSSETAPVALYNAGICYENCDYWSMVALIFSKYHNNFRTDEAKMTEAMFKEGHAYFMQKKYIDAVNAFQRMLYFHQALKEKNIEVDNYYAAQAKFTMAEINFEQFKMIKLDPPFEINMQRKQKIFNQMLQNYTATTKYEIADWTTAAFHKIGSAFETFAQDIMDSPPPDNATEEQIKAYRNTIWQKLAQPLIQKALEYYQANDRLATKISFVNDWIEQSRQRMSELSHKLEPNTQSSTTQVTGISDIAAQN